MRRRLLFIFAGIAAALVLAAATLPWWVGGAVRRLGASRGITFASYERIGYARFAVRDVEVRLTGVRVTATRAEADTPALWLWKHWRKNDGPVVAGEWRVEVAKPTTPSDPNAARGWLPLRTRLQRIANALDRWLPQAAAGPGLVRWPGGELAIASAKWNQRTLVVEDLKYGVLDLDATIGFGADDALRVSAKTNDGNAAATVENRGARVTGSATWWEQPATVDATFGARGWLPAEALVQAKQWTIPAARAKLGDAYATVRGAAGVEWREQRFTVDVTADGQPLPDKAAPPLNVRLKARGDTTQLAIEAVQIALPGVDAALSEPVTVERGGRLREGRAQFAVQADLAKLPWFKARGLVTGDARLVAGLAAAPVVEFSLDARDVAASGVELTGVTARGRVDGASVKIEEALVQGGEGEQLRGAGAWDFRAKEIVDGTLAGELRRKSLGRWLSAAPEFETIQVKVTAAGRLADVAHRGELRVQNLRTKGLNPVAASATWSGRGAVFDDVAVELRAGTGKIAARGRADAQAATLRELSLMQGDATRLQLTAPAVVRWRPALQVEPLRLAGPEGKLSLALTWGTRGQVEISGERVASTWLGDFVPKTGPAWTLSSITAKGAWDGGPMEFTVQAAAQLEIGDNRAARLEVTGRGGAQGLRIESLRAAESDTPVVSATGRVPIVVAPGSAPVFRVEPSGALELDATVSPNASFWPQLASVTGVELKDPQMAAQLKGTWQRPEGKATLRAARVAVDAKRFARPLPVIEALNVELNGDRDGVTLETFAVQVEGQAVRARGRLPVPEGKWSDLFRAPLAVARDGADLRLEVPDAEVAVFARFLPAVLAPAGRLQADLTYRKGGVDGFVRLRDAASRPLGPLGVLQEISADVALAGKTLTLREVTAKSGGQPVTLTGKVELPDQGGPRFDLALRGENLPFVRQTGLLLRGDLDLKLQTPTGAPPRLSGNVRLRDSLFLSDVRAFLPKGGGTSPARRPPYFAIETAPVNGWGLAIDVTGEEFLRLRTPVFVGVASARFRLSGTLGEPRAIGEVAINEGSIRMPFASFAVTQGAVRLTEADPYEPEVYLRGAGRRYGYDLAMEIDGSAAQPNIVFTSSPALDSEQVLLMVMTGAVPSNELAKTTTQRAANIGIFLGQSLLSSLGSDAAEADRLSFSSGEKISRRGKETYEAEYKLTDRWTVTGEYNEFDEYNAGFKWRVFGGKRTEDKPGEAKK